MIGGRPLALVTGGCHRLGGAIAAGLARAGWDVALHAHDHDEPDIALAEAIRETGCRWTVTKADLADPDAGAGLVSAVADEWGTIPRLLLNSAAIFGDDRLTSATGADLLRHYAINSAAPARISGRFAELVNGASDRRDRSIVNILDQRIAQPHGDQFSYTMTKIALAGMTRIAARDLAPAIRVNAVAPGLVLPTADYTAPMLERLAAAMPLARLPAPDDIVAAVIYLATAPAVTAQTIFVDAGASLKSWDRDFVHLASEDNG